MLRQAVLSSWQKAPVHWNWHQRSRIRDVLPWVTRHADGSKSNATVYHPRIWKWTSHQSDFWSLLGCSHWPIATVARLLKIALDCLQFQDAHGCPLDAHWMPTQCPVSWNRSSISFLLTSCSENMSNCPWPGMVEVFLAEHQSIRAAQLRIELRYGFLDGSSLSNYLQFQEMNHSLSSHMVLSRKKTRTNNFYKPIPPPYEEQTFQCSVPRLTLVQTLQFYGCFGHVWAFSNSNSTNYSAFQPRNRNLVILFHTVEIKQVPGSEIFRNPCALLRKVWLEIENDTSFNPNPPMIRQLLVVHDWNSKFWVGTVFGRIETCLLWVTVHNRNLPKATRIRNHGSKWTTLTCLPIKRT